MSLSIHHVVLSALMHDIGKVIQRTGAKDIPKFSDKCRLDPITKRLGYKHAMWTADFLDRHPLNLPESNWNSVVELAGSHHCKDSWKLHNYDKYLEIIMQADRISSSWDRDEPEEFSKDKERYLKMPLYSMFERIGKQENEDDYTKPKWIYPLQKLSASSVFPFEMKELNVLSDNYAKLLQGFEADYSELCKYFNDLAASQPDFEAEHFPQFIDAVDNLLKQYFWCVPANTMEANPAASLYHHLRNSAAIAAAMYAQQNSPSPSSEPPFIIIAADLNGIQSYLYDLNPENSTKASKLLRSRSFQIQMIMEMAAIKVVEELGLSPLSVFSNQGGKWFILANNSLANNQKLQKLKTQFSKEMFARFLGTVSINLTWDTKLGLADFGKKLFLKTMNRCFDSLEKEKTCRFSATLQDDVAWDAAKFVVNHDNLYHDDICDFCKRRQSEINSSENYLKYESRTNEEVKICSCCLQEIRLGRNLVVKTNYKIRRGDEKPDTFINFAGMNFEAATDSELDHFAANQHYFRIKEDAALPHLPLRYLATQVPVKDNRVCTYEDIARQSEGIQANAILKGDVDNLGYMMSRSWQKTPSGEPECSITEYTTLSFMTDYFFSAFIPELIKTNYPDSIYTIYSGGDDFCLLGAYDKVIDFALSLNDKFAAFCAFNPFLHFSAAITLAHPKEPVRFAIKSTDTKLDAAKELRGKNCVYLYETPVKWQELGVLLQFSQKLDTWLESKEIPLQFLYRLLSYHEMYLETLNETTNYRNYLYESLLHYDIKRNLEKMKNGQLSNPELVKTLKQLTGLQEGNMMKHLRIPLCHTIYKHRNM